jgi:CDP-diacylglycerol---serine O-phosphatidyltransferase
VFAVLPTLLTLGNAVCGFGAITFAAQWWGPNLATSLFAASLLVFLAMLFDALDGSTARRLNKTSEFGAQLDSLCDAISFGAAPAFIMLQFALATGYHPRLLWLVAALYVVCTVLRLARFNVENDEDEEKGSFSGLPSPAAAGTIASFPVMAFGLKHLEITEHSLLWDGFAAWLDAIVIWVLPPVTLAVACLMVSRVPYTHTFRQLVRGRRNGPYLIKLVFAVAVIFVMPQISAPILFGWYAFAPPVWAVWQKHVAPLFAKPADPAPDATAVPGPDG